MPIRKTIYFKKLNDGGVSSLRKGGLRDTIESLPPGNFKITVEEKLEVRSPDQNNWYWSVLNFLEKETETGYTSDEWHEVFKSEFLKEEKFIPGTDRSYVVFRSTTTLDKFEFMIYLEKILTFCENYLNINRKYLLPKVTSGW